jgi:hypothetical protein
MLTILALVLSCVVYLTVGVPVSAATVRQIARWGNETRNCCYRSFVEGRIRCEGHSDNEAGAWWTAWGVFWLCWPIAFLVLAARPAWRGLSAAMRLPVSGSRYVIQALDKREANR